MVDLGQFLASEENAVVRQDRVEKVHRATTVHNGEPIVERENIPEETGRQVIIDIDVESKEEEEGEEQEVATTLVKPRLRLSSRSRN